MAGLPGTGLGGIFYALLIAWMTVRELGLTLIGAGRAARWTKIARFGGLLGGIVLALWCEAWLLQRLLGGLQTIDERFAAPTTLSVALGALTPAFASAPFVVLALLLLMMHGARLLIPAVELASAVADDDRTAHQAVEVHTQAQLGRTFR